MTYNAKQIRNLVYALKRHIKGTDAEKKAAEKVMKKYGCNAPADAYRLIKRYRKMTKVSEAI